LGLSYQNFFFQNCLLTIFNAYLNGQTELLEKMIGCMIGFVHVPPPGGPKLTFSIGGSDSQVIQPPMFAELPSTQEAVAIIFNQLGKLFIFKITVLCFKYFFIIFLFLLFLHFSNMYYLHEFLINKHLTSIRIFMRISN